MADDKSDKTSMSILDKFRQLSKAKEVESQLDIATPSTTNQSIDAVYLTNSNCNVMGDKKHWRSFRGGSYQRGTKRKMDDDDIYPDDLTDKKMHFPHVGLKSEQVGITEFTSDHKGFQGIIKQRFSDFQVNEISLDNKIIRLTNQVIPALEQDVEMPTEEELNEVLPKEMWDKIRSIVETECEESVDIDVTNMSKQERFAIHSSIKRYFKQKVRSDTMDQNGKKIVKITYCMDAASYGDRSHWKDKEFLHCTLYKVNMDTSVAVNIIAQRLHTRANNITYSGTKDKRAVTSQMICVKRTLAPRLHGIQPLRDITLGNYEYSKASLKLGDLAGNRFHVVVRHVDVENDVISKAIDAVKEKGILNYFGMQRFGASVIAPTYVVGKALIHKDWKKAVELLLKPRPGERCMRGVAEARQVWWDTKNVRMALKYLSWKIPSVEMKLLEGLKRSGPNDYLNGLGNIPRNMIMFYGHSYQSLIWNKVISRRVKEFGLIPLAGDIVMCNSECTDEEEVIKKNDVDAEKNTDESDEFQEMSKRFNVKYLTEEDAKNAKIDDVVYPLPGYDIKYPKNVIADWYDEFLKEDDITKDLFIGLKPYANVIPLYGAYRKMIERPGDITWSTIKYSDDNTDLLVNDKNAMRGAKPVETCADGQYKALLLEFSLPPCTYATMVIREIMKTETGSSFHAQLTAQVQMNMSVKSDCKEGASEEGDKDVPSNGEANESYLKECDS